MINRIRALFTDRGGSPADGGQAHGADELRLASAALLVEAALMDERFDTREREVIANLVRARFGLSQAEAASLLDAAEESVGRSSQLFGFVRVINSRFSHEERVELMEMLWQVAYADGELHDFEAALMRRVAGLIHVPDRESGEARKRALDRLGVEGHER